MSENTVTLRGVDRLEEVLVSKREDLPERLREGIKYQLSSTSFFQVNTAQAVALFEQVYDGVKPNHSDQVDILIDAYAGVGAMSLFLSPVAKKIIAIEEHAAAVEDGIKNAGLNGIENVEFKRASVEEALLDCLAQGVTPDVVVVDPPRKGMTEEALLALLQLAPIKIIYVSCNPATLARDLKIFQNGGWKDKSNEKINSNQNQVGDRVADVEKDGNPCGATYAIKKVQPVDLFPHTHHIESVTVLERTEIK